MDYSEKALAALQQADQLDTPTNVIRPRTWAVSGAVALALLGVLLWGIFGSVAQEASAPGVLTPAAGTQRQEALVSGQVVAVTAQPGSVIAEGDPVLTLADPRGARKIVASRLTGRVVAVLTEPGRVVAQGTPLMIVEPVAPSGDLLSAVVFFPAGEVAAVAPGMEVNLSVASADAAQYGTVLGRVEHVDQRPLTVDELQDIVSNDSVAAAVAQGGPVVAVDVKIDHNRANRSGIRWSRNAGPPFRLEGGTLVQAQITQRSQSPINLAFGG